MGLEAQPRALFLSCDIEWHVGAHATVLFASPGCANVPAFSGYRFSLRISGDAAINYAAAKSDQLTLRQKELWGGEGIGDFLQGECRPGLGGHEKAVSQCRGGQPGKMIGT